MFKGVNVMQTIKSSWNISMFISSDYIKLKELYIFAQGCKKSRVFSFTFKVHLAANIYVKQEMHIEHCSILF